MTDKMIFASPTAWQQLKNDLLRAHGRRGLTEENVWAQILAGMLLHEGDGAGVGVGIVVEANRLHEAQTELKEYIVTRREKIERVGAGRVTASSEAEAMRTVEIAHWTISGDAEPTLLAVEAKLVDDGEEG